MAIKDDSVSFYFFEIDDDPLFPPTQRLCHAQQPIGGPLSAGARPQPKHDLGRAEPWANCLLGPDPCGDIRQQPGVPPDEHRCSHDIRHAIEIDDAWEGPASQRTRHRVGQLIRDRSAAEARIRETHRDFPRQGSGTDVCYGAMGARRRRDMSAAVSLHFSGSA